MIARIGTLIKRGTTTDSDTVRESRRCRADLDEFVAFEGQPRSAGLSTSRSDLTARVFVGRKGAGKTIYLRRQQAHAKEDDSLYVDAVQADFPPTHLVVAYNEAFDPVDQVEAWTRLWRRAIARSIFSHVIQTGYPVYSHGVDRLLVMADTYSAIAPKRRTPTSVYTELADLLTIGSFRSKRVDQYLGATLWSEFEHDLADVLARSKPISLYLDGLDEAFQQAPAPWLKCQQGLLIQVMRMLFGSVFRDRLHVAIGVRDIAYAAVLESEHGTRYRNEQHIRILDWDSEALKELLIQKINRLPSEFLMKPDDDDPFIRWLGTGKIVNEVFDTEETVSDYLIRHARFIPRDIVQVGNDLCHGITVAKARNRTSLTDPQIREVVRTAARSFGNEQLLICANQIMIDSIPKAASRSGPSDGYIGNTGYQRGLDARIRELVRTYLRDRFDSYALEQFNEQGRLTIGQHVDLASVLWQNGLLGYESEPTPGSAVFHSAATSEQLLVPQRKSQYFLHPCLTDSIDGLHVGGTKPVRPVTRLEETG